MTGTQSNLSQQFDKLTGASGTWIPDNTHAIQDEIDRLREVGDRLRDAATAIRHLGLDSWHGSTADTFEAHRSKLARQWSYTADEHERSAGALADYRDVLLTLQPLARDAVERANWGGDWTRARADIDRWQELADAAAYRTANVLRDVAARLRYIPPLIEIDIGEQLDRSQPFAAMMVTCKGLPLDRLVDDVSEIYNPRSRIDVVHEALAHASTCDRCSPEGSDRRTLLDQVVATAVGALQAMDYEVAHGDVHRYNVVLPTEPIQITTLDVSMRDRPPPHGHGLVVAAVRDLPDATPARRIIIVGDAAQAAPWARPVETESVCGVVAPADPQRCGDHGRLRL